MKKIYILNLGAKKTKVKIDKEKYKIRYMSKKEYKDEIEELKQINVKPTLIGYTPLKQKSDNYIKKHKENIVGQIAANFADNVSVVEKKKKKFRKITGYLSAPNNQFIAIEKFNPLILLILLLFGIVCLLTIHGLLGNGAVPIDPWHPDIEEIVDYDDENNNDIQQIQIAGFSSWHIPAGQKENIPVSLKNPDGNPCYFSFDIYLKDTNEVLYTSKMVKPGDTIKKINLKKALVSGKYTAIVHINTNEINTGIEMNDALFEVNLTVS